ncbi:MAG: DUF58 domain-containing protein [Chloroflexi bacterium]|nr:DUF58 domain-containing protein [Chloroflexota bacterium]
MFSQFWQDFWVLLFAVLIIVGVFAGEGAVLAFGVMGLAIAGISLLWNRVSLDQVSYERRFSRQRVFIDEDVTITITLANKKPVPLGRIKVEDEIPDGIEIEDADLTTSASPNAQTLRLSTSVAWYEKISWNYRVRGRRRGLYYFGPARMQSGDLFGFYASRRTEPNQDYILVYPRVVPLPDLGLPASRPLGEVGGGINIFPDPSRPSSIRDYQQGDPLKIMDWKASAKTQRLQVRTFDPSSSTTVVLVVATETTVRPWEGYSAVNLERVITAAASVASYATERQYSLGLFSNGAAILSDRPMKVAPSRSPDQLTLILEALATIRPLPMGPMAPQLAEHARRIPMGATLVVVTALMTQELADTIATLKDRGYRMVVLNASDEEFTGLPEDLLVHDVGRYLETMELASEFAPR